MAANARIVVEPGAKLIVDGGIITNPCGEFWGGIHVQGNSNLPQLPIANQGYVVVKNGAIIENAFTGIHTLSGGLNVIGSAHGGGVVRIDNAKFINNYMSIRFFPYKNTNIARVIKNDMSCVQNCIFEINDGFNSTATPNCFIYAEEVKLGNIRGNEFKNTNTDPTIQYKDKGIGIHSYNAKFNTGQYGITNPVANIFNNLYYGIKAYNTGINNHTFTVDKSEFENCFRGIYVNAVNNAVITSNIFKPYNTSRTSGRPYGLYLDGCNDYDVEDNYFEAVDITAAKDCGGMIINNSGYDKNLVYNNFFNQLDFGVIATGNNRGLDYNYGLKIKCNDFTNCTDIAVSSQLGYTGIVGISEYQGFNNSETAPAGNRFSYLGINPAGDYNNTGEYLKYFHHNGSITTGTDIWVPKYISSGILRENVFQYFFNKPSSCPPIIVNNYNSPSDWHNSISLIAPNLNSAKLVLIANPQCTRSADVMGALYDRNNPLPEYMIDEILQEEDDISQLELLEAEVAYFSFEKDIALTQLTKIFINDTINPDAPDTLLAILSRDDNLYSCYDIVTILTGQGRIRRSVCFIK